MQSFNQKARELISGRNLMKFVSIVERRYVYKVCYTDGFLTSVFECVESLDPDFVEKLSSGVCPWCGRRYSPRGLIRHLKRSEEAYMNYLRYLYNSCYANTVKS